MTGLLKTNEHPIERGVRIVLGLGLIGMAAIGTVGMWGYIGVVPLLTGIVGTCPIYTALGFSTCPVKTTSH